MSSDKGAKGLATRAELAAESSPWLTSLAARSARRLCSGGETGGSAYPSVAGMQRAALCAERSSEEFWRALEKETALLKEHLQIHLVKTGKGRTNSGAV